MMSEHSKLLSVVAAQLMNGEEVVIGEGRIPVSRVGTGRLRCVRFNLNGRQMVAIEQNRSKPSRWGELARKGHQVVQFQDLATRKYLAVAMGGDVIEYSGH